MLDEVLLDEVTIGIYLRLQSVTIATQAAYGRVECPQCAEVVRRMNEWNKGEVIRCACGWQTTWQVYFDHYHQQHLIWGGCFPAVRDYMDGFLVAETPRDKIMLVDRLIHYLHWEMVQDPGRPAATMVIEGKEKEVVALIESLAYGNDGMDELRQTQQDWQSKRQPRPINKTELSARRAVAYEQARQESEAFATRHRQVRLAWAGK